MKTMNVSTKKARFIDTLSTLSDAEKDEVKSFFSKHSVYENKIDWNNKNLCYTDFQQVFKLADSSSKNRKQEAKKNPIMLFTSRDCKIITQTKDFIIATPLTWECAVYFNSFKCGGEGAKWCIGDKKRSDHWNRYIEDGIVFFFVYFLNKDFIFGKKIIISYSTNCDTFNLYLATDKRIWSGQGTSGLLSCLFRKIKKNMLRKSLWHTLLLYEKNMNRQLFFDFDIFKKNKIHAAKIKSYANIMEIIHILGGCKDLIDRRIIVPCKKSPADCTVDELLDMLRDEYYYKFSSQFSDREAMSPANMERLMKIASLLYDKSIKLCKKPSSSYSSGDLIDMLFDHFYFKSNFLDSPGKPKLFMGMIGMIYDKWVEENKKKSLL
jgi:hypothetical protein